MESQENKNAGIPSPVASATRGADNVWPAALAPFKSLADNTVNISLLLKQLETCVGVVPFIGAGMSVQFGFPAWRAFLESLATDAAMRQNIVDMLDHGQYEEAAEALREERGENAFHATLEDTFGEHQFHESRSAAITQLPRLSSGPVLTTNFDPVLEKVFKNAGQPFEERVLGMKRDVIRQAFHSNRRVLLKLHGDSADRTDRVFTWSDYERNYGEHEPLTAILRFAMIRPLLFLGCSLRQDRTVRVLEALANELRGRGATGLQVHYAVVEQPARVADFIARNRRLAELGIRPIWYPNGQHELVADLLMHLAGEVDKFNRREGGLHNVPELPPHFLTPNDLDVLKQHILNPTHKPVGITAVAIKTGIHGMGGIGKTVLAATLARDSEIRQAFPDGVIWVTLGLTPQITALQAQIVQAMGEIPPFLENEQQGRSYLSGLLADRTALLVFDDVWHEEHLVPFNVIGPRSQMVITTRDARIVHRFGAVEHHVHKLSEEQAFDLLSHWSKIENWEPHRPVGFNLVRECGCLPLAIAMIGARVRGNPDELYQQLSRLRARNLKLIERHYPEYQYPHLFRAIEVSVETLNEDSIPGLRERYLDFAVFPEDNPVPPTVLDVLWRAHNAGEDRTGDIIDRLVDLALLRREKKGWLGIHDLQLGYLRKVTQNEIKKFHARLVDAYAAECEARSPSFQAHGGTRWARGPNDGYFFQQIASHCQRSGNANRLFALARDKTFLTAQAAAVPSAPDLPLRTLKSAMETARDADDAPAMAEFCLRYAYRLQEAREGNPWVEWENGNVAGAMHLAEQQEPDRMCLWFLHFITLSHQARPEVARICLRRLLNLEARLPRFEEEWQENAVLEHLVSIGTLDAASAGRLARRLLDDENQFHLTEEFCRAHQPSLALQIALQINDNWFRSRALAHTALHCGEDKQPDAVGILNEALATARRISLREHRCRAFAQVAVCFGRLNRSKALELINEALKLVLAVTQEATPEHLRFIVPERALVDVANGLLRLGHPEAEHLFDKALAESRKAGRLIYEQPTVLLEVACGLHQLGRPEAAQVFGEAQAAAERSHKGWAIALTAVANALSMWDRSTAIAVFKDALTVSRVKRGPFQRPAFARVALGLWHLGQPEAEEVFTEALVAVRKMGDDDQYRFETIVDLAQCLKKVGLSEIADELFRESITPKEKVTGIERFKARALTAVARSLEQEGRTEAVKASAHALAVVSLIDNEHDRAKILMELVEEPEQPFQLAPVEVLNRALAKAKLIGSEEDRSDALAVIARGFLQSDSPEATEVLNEALLVAQQITYLGPRAEALAKVARVLGQFGIKEAAEVFDEAMEEASRIVAETERSRTLTRVARQLMESDRAKSLEALNEALMAARGIKDNFELSNVLAYLADTLGQTYRTPETARMLGEIRTATRQIATQQFGNPGDRTRPLLSIADAIGHFDRSAAFEVITEALAAERQNYQHHYWNLPAVGLQMFRLGSPEAANVFREAFERARKMDGRDKSQMLGTLAYVLGLTGSPEFAEMLAEVLKITQQLALESERSSALSGVVCGDAMLKRFEEASNIAMAILNNRFRHSIDIAETVVDQNSKEGTKAFLIFSAEFVHTAWIVVRGLSRIYPREAEAIWNAISSVEKDLRA